MKRISSIVKYIKKSPIEYTYTLIFLITLPIAASINYMQNDEYTYYRLVWNFLAGNFNLDPYIGATFYVQGFLGTLYSLFFGWKNLPVLTLIVSIGSIYIFAKIINKFFNQNYATSILLSLILFLNPLFLYSSFGFMTENYFLFFTLGAVYFIFGYTKNTSNKNKFIKLFFANLYIFLAYLVRQFSFVTSLAFAIYLFFKKNYLHSFIQVVFFLLLLLFHYKVFPITPQMYESNLNVIKLLDIKNTVNIFFAILVYISIFFAPLVIIAALKTFNTQKPYRKFMYFVIFIFLVFYFKSNFKPYEIEFVNRSRTGEIYTNYANTNFPYFDNVFNRKGFLTNDIRGTKYHYKGFFDLFVFLEYFGLILAVFLITTALFNIKQIFNFSIIYILGFMSLLAIAPRIFDRYLILLLPFFILFFIKICKDFNSKLKRLVIIASLFFWLILNYVYLSDYIKLNNYVWEKSEQIAYLEKIDKKYISPTHSWRQLYDVKKSDTKYIFSYNSLNNEPNFKNKFELIETKTIDFFGSLYIKPKIYLYKRIISSN